MSAADVSRLEQMFSRFAGCRRDHIPPKESDISDAADVCFGSKADVTLLNFNVRFLPRKYENGEGDEFYGAE